MADLEQGPCSEQFSNLEACAAEKKSKNPQARIDNPKAKVVPRVTSQSCSTTAHSSHTFTGPL